MVQGKGFFFLIVVIILLLVKTGYSFFLFKQREVFPYYEKTLSSPN